MFGLASALSAVSLPREGRGARCLCLQGQPCMRSLCALPLRSFPCPQTGWHLCYPYPFHSLSHSITRLPDKVGTWFVCRATTFGGLQHQLTMSFVSPRPLALAVSTTGFASSTNEVPRYLTVFMQLPTSRSADNIQLVNMNLCAIPCSHFHLHQWWPDPFGCLTSGDHQEQYVCCCHLCHGQLLLFQLLAFQDDATW